jgi:hypothetical protein
VAVLELATAPNRHHRCISYELSSCSTLAATAVSCHSPDRAASTPAPACFEILQSHRSFDPKLAEGGCSRSMGRARSAWRHGFALQMKLAAGLGHRVLRCGCVGRVAILGQVRNPKRNRASRTSNRWHKFFGAPHWRRTSHQFLRKAGCGVF